MDLQSGPEPRLEVVVIQQLVLPGGAVQVSNPPAVGIRAMA